MDGLALPEIVRQKFAHSNFHIQDLFLYSPEPDSKWRLSTRSWILRSWSSLHLLLFLVINISEHMFFVKVFILSIIFQPSMLSICPTTTILSNSQLTTFMI